MRSIPNPAATTIRSAIRFSGEDAPPRPVELPWSPAEAQIVDAFGATRTVTTGQGRLSLALSVTPIVVSAIS